MSSADPIRVAFRGRLEHFILDAAFTVPARGVTAIFGPSGCGKTTVLRCIAGLHHLADGFCAIGDDVWQDGASFRPTHRRPIGFVFQEASLFPHLSVRRNLLFGAPKPDHSAEVDGLGWEEVIGLLGLGKLLDRSPRNLSGGERQRVAIGRALLSRPKLLLMDEPLSALDRGTRDEILPFLERLHASLAVPVLYVSHDMAEVERLAHHMVLMQAGRVRAAGPLAALQSDPTLPLAAARDASVSLEAIVEGYDAAFGLVTLKTGNSRFVVPGRGGLIGKSRRLHIAASDVSLARSPQESTILNILPVHVLSATPVGEHEMLAVLGLEPGGDSDKLLARVTRKSWHRLGLAEGQHVFAHIKGVALAPSADPG